jgi:predicted glutamine amidotransferase
MTLDQYMGALETHRDRELLLHLRIATHGTISAEMTHPFLGADHSYPILAHNGVVSNWGDKKESDTYQLYHHVISKLDCSNALRTLDYIADATGSKFAYIDRSGALELIGDFITYNGLQVSNMSLGSYNYFPRIKPGFKSVTAYSVDDWEREQWTAYEYNMAKDTEEEERDLALTKLMGEI